MKNLLALALVALLTACGGGTPDPATVDPSPHPVTINSLPISNAPWTVSYGDVQRILDACYPDATVSYVTNPNIYGYSLLFVGDAYVGDPADILAHLPTCPAPLVTTSQ